MGVIVQSPFHIFPLSLGERARERGQTGRGTERLPMGEALVARAEAWRGSAWDAFG